MKLTSNAAKCFICHQEVFELDGQFQNFKSYGLDETDIAITEGAIGKCHCSCLETSKWGEYWFKIKHIQFTEVQKYKTIEFKNLHLYFRNEFDDLFVMSEKGVFYSFTKKELESSMVSFPKIRNV